MKKFYAIFKARTMEYVRDRGSLMWNLAFPFLLVIGFAIAFGRGDDALFKVGVMHGVYSTSSYELDTILDNPAMEVIDYHEPVDVVLRKLQQHQIDLIIDFDNQMYYLNNEANSSFILEPLLEKAYPSFHREQVAGKAVRYVDWLVPGIIAMSMLFSCLYGVGFVIVRYRKNGVLKRLKASPINPFTFVSAQMASRFIIVFLTSVFVFAGTNLFLHFSVVGSYLWLVVVLSLGILCMISMGLIFAARIKNEELAGGLINLVTFPMMIFSGVFFSLEGTPVFIQKAAQFFPLTHFLTATRAVMIDGAGFYQIWPQLLILSIMTLVFLGISSLFFRWE
ncbi:ABC transporter permease [Spirochaeta cellobiosiphila]|uniref:ABC transporter permease n=1 Tax=Spirochaeta cellobiosiphila TaxID=504483 RepID=UPI0004032672|nr:ABC transporter permease [Spirochaeta cellobiosiphila]